MEGSGFEDVIFQSSVCTSGSLRGVLSGSHYNRGWTVHNAFSEALERLLLVRFLYDNGFDDLPTVGNGEDLPCEDLATFLQRYGRFQMQVRCGSKGKTPQFWMMYLDLFRVQTFAHTAIQINDLEMFTYAWKRFVPMYFATNKVNYARYGSYYLHTLINMDTIYPGLRNLLKKSGLSVQGQDAYPLRTSVDQRGEQTINRDGKTSGKNNLPSDKSSIVLNNKSLTKI